MKEVNIDNPCIHVVDDEKVDTLWSLFKEYHCEVSKYNAERPLPSETIFKSFWCQSDKLAMILYSGQQAIGFTLIQKISAENNFGPYIEVGAIFVKKDFRKGLNGVSLFQVVFDIGNQLSLPIASEVAEDNDLSLKLARLLALRYKRHKGDGILSEIKLKNGRLFLKFEQFDKSKKSA
jgi:hypothetical protein